jgi:hypothetical protein
MGVTSLTIEKKKWSDQQRKLARRRKAPLKQSEGSAGACLWVQLGPVVEAQVSLLVNDM